MIRRSILLLLALLALPVAQATAQQSAPTQLDHIEAKLDELLRRLPAHAPDLAAPAIVGQAGAGPATRSTPADYRPGALAVARPMATSAAVLAIPPDSVGGFVYTGGTLRLDDLSGRGLRYRGLAGVELQGWLRAREAGRYQLAVDFGSPHASNSFLSVSCGVALWLEDRQVAQRTGELMLAPGNGAASAPLPVLLGAELQPGLYKLRLWVACGRTVIQPLVLLTADVLLKAPSELNLRGITADDVAHREE